MEVHCKRCWARAVITASPHPGHDPVEGFKLEVRSDFEQNCVLRREQPETTLEEFDCEYLMRAVQEALDASRQNDKSP